MAMFNKKEGDASNTAGGVPPAPSAAEQAPPPPPEEYAYPPPDGGGPPPEQGYAAYPDQSAENFSVPQYGTPVGGDDIKERVEEIAEAIIDEKWNELIKDINKVIEWKEKTETEINTIEQEIANLKERFESLHRGVLGKITEYDNNLANVGSEIKAMDMVFKKILPTFTENVQKLERITRGVNSVPKG